MIFWAAKDLDIGQGFNEGFPSNIHGTLFGDGMRRDENKHEPLIFEMTEYSLDCERLNAMLRSLCLNFRTRKDACFS